MAATRGPYISGNKPDYKKGPGDFGMTDNSLYEGKEPDEEGYDQNLDWRDKIQGVDDPRSNSDQPGGGMQDVINPAMGFFNEMDPYGAEGRYGYNRQTGMQAEGSVSRSGTLRRDIPKLASLSGAAKKGAI